MTFLFEMMKLGLGNLRRHKLRSILTALGIILGVGAVITTVSVGEGSKRQALDQLERLGAKNVIIRSQKPPESQQMGGGQQQQSFVAKYGLTRDDLKNLRQSFPDAENIVPLKAVGSQILRQDRRKTSQSFGTTPELKEVANLRVARGRYLTQEDLEERSMVAVVGAEVAKEFFPFDDPLGNSIRIDDKIVRIIGILAPVGLSGGAGAALVGRDLNLDIHLPITTCDSVFGDTIFRRESGSRNISKVEVSEIYLVAPEREEVLGYAELTKRLMAVRHDNLKDIGIIVPYELLENAKRTALQAQIMLAAIAGISLLVGGIGIMNIMLASVTERTREIGIRRALGATRSHIVWQFLIETGVLSAIGGLIGVVLGVGFSRVLTWGVPKLPGVWWIGRYVSADAALPTHVTLWSILVAFLVAAATGLVFGIYPALKAAKQDPIVALRHD
ncbi:MAG: ABC transporter permease [Phycisphaeraceae bacterium]|nr:ABC transporter permease [Phycisphaeraceae bacterium]